MVVMDGVAMTVTPPPDTEANRADADEALESDDERLFCTTDAVAADAVTILAVRTTEPAWAVTVTADAGTLARTARIAAISFSLDAVKSLTSPAVVIVTYALCCVNVAAPGVPGDAYGLGGGGGSNGGGDGVGADDPYGVTSARASSRRVPGRSTVTTEPTSGEPHVTRNGPASNVAVA